MEADAPGAAQKKMEGDEEEEECGDDGSHDGPPQCAVCFAPSGCSELIVMPCCGREGGSGFTCRTCIEALCRGPGTSAARDSSAKCPMCRAVFVLSFDRMLYDRQDKYIFKLSAEEVAARPFPPLRLLHAGTCDRCHVASERVADVPGPRDGGGGDGGGGGRSDDGGGGDGGGGDGDGGGGDDDGAGDGRGGHPRSRLQPELERVCSACLLGDAFALRYECCHCLGIQRIRHALWQTQRGPDRFGEQLWACAACSAPRRWRILADDLVRVPEFSVPPCWGPRPEFLHRFANARLLSESWQERDTREYEQRLAECRARCRAEGQLASFVFVVLAALVVLVLHLRNAESGEPGSAAECSAAQQQGQGPGAGAQCFTVPVPASGAALSTSTASAASVSTGDYASADGTEGAEEKPVTLGPVGTTLVVLLFGARLLLKLERIWRRA